MQAPPHRPGPGLRAQTPAAPQIEAAEVEPFVDGVIAAQLAAFHLPGATISIVQDGALRFAKGYGYADIEQQIPVVVDKTLFRPGSISKLFVWTAVMQLVEQGTDASDGAAQVDGDHEYREQQSQAGTM